MSATDELRRLLDERGIEWSATSGSMGTIWTHWDTFNGCRVHAMDNGDGTVEIFGGWDVTSEQAIAATLGSSNCSNNCTNSERTDATRLPHFWTHDGVLHIEATRMPTRIVVCEGGTCEFVPKRELDASEAENAKLREFASEAFSMAFNFYHGAGTAEDLRELKVEYYELGIEVDDA